MKKIALLAGAALILAGGANPAEAQWRRGGGWYGGHGGYYHGGYYGHRGWGGGGAVGTNFTASAIASWPASGIAPVTRTWPPVPALKLQLPSRFHFPPLIC